MDPFITGLHGRGSTVIFGQGSISVQTVASPALAGEVVSQSDIVFTPVSAPLTSRYSGSSVVSFLSGLDPFISPWNAIRITADPTDTIMSVTMGMAGRLDIISLRKYGTELLWWAIASANDIINPIEQPVAGDKIRIPMLPRVLKILGHIGSGTELSRYHP